jgi:hypothetical protein
MEGDQRRVVAGIDRGGLFPDGPLVRRKVDTSARPRAAPMTARTSWLASAAHCPIAPDDLAPAINAAIPTASSPASG